MKIAIRMDDITPDMNWDNFIRFKKLLDSHNIKPLIGIVPDNQDLKLHFEVNGAKAPADFWQEMRRLRDEEGWTIAMHGLTHIYTTKKGGLLPLNHQSEFAGLPLQTQTEMLAKGRKILAEHDIETDIFMAPSHTYDNNTLAALKANDFTKITDGFGYAPYTWKGITFYPISFNRGSVQKAAMKERNQQENNLQEKKKHEDNLQEQEKGIQTQGNAGTVGKTSSNALRERVVTFVVHTNTMTDRDFESYEQLFNKYDIISYSDLLAMAPTSGSVAQRIREYCMASLKYILVKCKSSLKRRSS